MNVINNQRQWKTTCLQRGKNEILICNDEPGGVIHSLAYSEMTTLIISLIRLFKCVLKVSEFKVIKN